MSDLTPTNIVHYEKRHISEFVDKDGKNKFDVICPYKTSLKKTKDPVFLHTPLPGQQIKSLKIEQRKDPEKLKKSDAVGDVHQYFWELFDIFNFENVGVTRAVKGVHPTLENFKYFICCDCDFGPIGIQDENLGILIAHDRIRYDAPPSKDVAEGKVDNEPVVEKKKVEESGKEKEESIEPVSKEHLVEKNEPKKEIKRKEEPVDQNKE